MVDLTYGSDGSLLYYPEYGIDLGEALDAYSLRDGIYQRKFQKGIVLVNSDERKSYTFRLDKEYSKIIPTGGGQIQEDGTCKGSITYESVKNKIVLLPISAAVLVNNAQGPQDTSSSPVKLEETTYK